LRPAALRGFDLTHDDLARSARNQRCSRFKNQARPAGPPALRSFDGVD
jgi:hypothetical protein